MNMDDPVVGFTMHMSLKWQWDISFIFERYVPVYAAGPFSATTPVTSSWGCF
jgi:hypothetical protein